MSNADLKVGMKSSVKAIIVLTVMVIITIYNWVIFLETKVEKCFVVVVVKFLWIECESFEDGTRELRNPLCTY